MIRFRSTTFSLFLMIYVRIYLAIGYVLLMIEMLQNELDRIKQWCDSNKLNLNVYKCKSKSLTIKHYDMNNIIANKFSSVKVLGVIFNNELSFRQHIETKVSEIVGILPISSLRKSSILPMLIIFCVIV